MTHFKASIPTGLALIAVVILAAGPAIADKPSWAGGDKHEKHGHKEKHHDHDDDDDEHHKHGGERSFKGDDPGINRVVVPDYKGGDPGINRVVVPDYKGGDPGVTRVVVPGYKTGDPGRYFINDPQRVVIRNYYDNEYRTGHCPPGLIKKDNRCLPPGQAKKWTIGRPLPRDVIFYDLPTTVVTTIGQPPPGYRFVRVGPDILLISTGLGIVADVINNWGQ